MKKSQNAQSNHKSSPGSEPLLSPEQSLQQEAFNGRVVTRQDIRDGLSRDLRGLFITLQEVLRSSECIDALTDVYYARYQRLRESTDAVPSSDEVENGGR